MSEKGADFELKTTTKINELPMRPVPYYPWPTSWSMEDSVRSGFFKGGKDTRLSYVLGSLYCGGMVFEIIKHVYGTFAPEMYSWTVISLLRKVINDII
jgi:hypothetical protein